MLTLDFRWWCYNTTVGNPYIISRVPKQTSREETAWSYDNSENSRPFEDTWTEAWSNSRSATLSISAGGEWTNVHDRYRASPDLLTSLRKPFSLYWMAQQCYHFRRGLVQLRYHHLRERDCE